VIRTLASIAIREMRLDDLPEVLAIDRLSFPNPWPERSYRYELTENRASTLLVADREEEGMRRVVGYLGYWLIVDEVHISTLAVHPDFRGQGIGRRLLQDGLHSARSRGAHMATLEVRPSNHAAIELYQDFGFVVVGRRAGYYRDSGEDALLMTLPRLRKLTERTG
jgi:ribosomal-protein-alanine N-acetyltransferase